MLTRNTTCIADVCACMISRTLQCRHKLSKQPITMSCWHVTSPYQSLFRAVSDALLHATNLNACSTNTWPSVINYIFCTIITWLSTTNDSCVSHVLICIITVQYVILSTIVGKQPQTFTYTVSNMVPLGRSSLILRFTLAH